MKRECENCLFWHQDDDENGTCEITEIITDAKQSGCVDYRNITTGKE